MTDHIPNEKENEVSVSRLNSDSEIFLEKLANDYSQYFQTDSSIQQQKFNESVEDMLTKLDEFCTLVDMIRGDTSLCLQKTIPEIQAKCFEMQTIFNRIDHLEAFVDVVRQNIGLMEECISKAEDDMGSFSNFKKIFTSLIGSKTAQQTKKEISFIPPKIFETDKYFPNVDSMTCETTRQMPPHPVGSRQTDSASAGVDKISENISSQLANTQDTMSTKQPSPLPSDDSACDNPAPVEASECNK